MESRPSLIVTEWIIVPSCIYVNQEPCLGLLYCPSFLFFPFFHGSLFSYCTYNSGIHNIYSFKWALPSPSFTDVFQWRLLVSSFNFSFFGLQQNTDLGNLLVNDFGVKTSCSLLWLYWPIYLIGKTIFIFLNGTSLAKLFTLAYCLGYNLQSDGKLCQCLLIIWVPQHALYDWRCLGCRGLGIFLWIWIIYVP